VTPFRFNRSAIVIRKFQRRLNIAISDFLDIGVYGFEEDFENKEEDDDSKLAVYDPRTGEKIRDAEDDEDASGVYKKIGINFTGTSLSSKRKGFLSRDHH
jgi:hypothetical protein